MCHEFLEAKARREQKEICLTAVLIDWSIDNKILRRTSTPCKQKLNNRGCMVKYQVNLTPAHFLD